MEQALASSKRKHSSKPPEAPELHRRMIFGRLQLGGLLLILAIPVLAAFNLFGEARTVTAARGASITLTVDYPSRIRHGTLDRVSVLLKNESGSPLDTVRVEFDSSYVARFAEPQFIPAESRAFEVELADIAPGETRRVHVGLRANDYGRHRGRVAAMHSSDSVDAVIRTIVFP